LRPRQLAVLLASHAVILYRIGACPGVFLL
jgi:hypothetical protein